MNSQILRNKNAVIYGAGGSLGSTIARAIAKEGANVFLAGRHLSSVKEVATKSLAPADVQRPHSWMRPTKPKSMPSSIQ